jgi:hypothetical protein
VSSGDKRQLGKILLQRKLVPARELEAALRAQRRTPTPMPAATPAPPQEEPEDQELKALCALADQYGVPAIDLGQVVIVLEHLDLIPVEVATSLRILPVLVREDRIYLAMADPTDERAIDEVEFVTGRNVHACVALHATLLATIAAAYDAKAHGERHYVGPRVPAT